MTFSVKSSVKVSVNFPEVSGKKRVTVESVPDHISDHACGKSLISTHL